LRLVNEEENTFYSIQHRILVRIYDVWFGCKKEQKKEKKQILVPASSFNATLNFYWPIYYKTPQKINIEQELGKNILL